jgi:hypothetical protein
VARASPSPNAVIREGLLSLPNLDFAIQNCNSLNVSLNTDKQTTKIAAITSILTGINFLSDIRLNADPASNMSDLFKGASNKKYKFFHNSSKIKRGVGILISSEYSISVIDSIKDQAQNILGLVIDIDSCRILLVSVHGPNSNDDNFFYNTDEYFQ